MAHKQRRHPLWQRTDRRSEWWCQRHRNSKCNFSKCEFMRSIVWFKCISNTTNTILEQNLYRTNTQISNITQIYNLAQYWNKTWKNPEYILTTDIYSGQKENYWNFCHKKFDTLKLNWNCIHMMQSSHPSFSFVILKQGRSNEQCNTFVHRVDKCLQSH